MLRASDWSGYSNYSTMPHLLPFESEVDATWRQPFMELNLLQSNAARARDPIHTARVTETSAFVHRIGYKRPGTGRRGETMRPTGTHRGRHEVFGHTKSSPPDSRTVESCGELFGEEDQRTRMKVTLPIQL